MIVAQNLLAPLAGGNPSGPSVRYGPFYDRIKQARREDPFDDPPLKADWGQVAKLATEVLAGESKDLWIAAWLTEALLRRDGIPGLAAGLGLVQGLLETFWDDVHPQPEEGDLEMRAAPLAWIGSYLDVPVRLAPLNLVGHGYLEYRESRSVPAEQEAKADKDKRARREAALAEGKLDPESFEAAFGDTPKAWYQELVASVETSLAGAARLETLCDERFGDDAPGFRKLRDALGEVRRAANALLDRKLAAEPAVAEPGTVAPASPGPEAVAGEAAGPGDATAPKAAASAVTTEPVAADVPTPVTPPDTSGFLEQLLAGNGESTAPPASTARPAEARDGKPWPASREEAAEHIAVAARYLRQQTPTDPAPYLMVRGFRWGELRANGGTIDARLLEAPPTELRTCLKRFLLDGNWAVLVEVAEQVTVSPFGRGWLDLQRYVVTALEGLGPDYAPAADAVRGALRSLLDDLPELVEASLMDDAPTANRETLDWLLAQGILRPDQANQAVEAVSAAPAEPVPESADRILKRLGTSEPQRAIEILMRNAERDKSERSRFLRRVDAARVMIENGHERVALPILRRMLEQIEQHRLEEWEASQTVAGALGLLYRCLDRLGQDSKERDALYLRVCRLDPLQAMAVRPEGGPAGADGEA